MKDYREEFDRICAIYGEKEALSALSEAKKIAVRYERFEHWTLAREDDRWAVVYVVRMLLAWKYGNKEE